ncbi:MAG: hypothetical protein WC595_04795 [Candidatus Nanoarchaeia archaeon]
MYTTVYTMGGRKSFSEITLEIKELLEKEGSHSIRKVALQTKTQRVTALKSLELLQSLSIIEEVPNKEDNRETRLFRIKK